MRNTRRDDTPCKTCRHCGKSSKLLVIVDGLCGTCRGGKNGSLLPVQCCSTCPRQSTRLVLRDGRCGRCYTRYARGAGAPPELRRQHTADMRAWRASNRAKRGLRPLWVAIDTAGRPLGVYTTPHRAERVSPWVREFRLDKVVINGK